jgi:hypothetical protein
MSSTLCSHHSGHDIHGVQTLRTVATLQDTSSEAHVMQYSFGSHLNPPPLIHNLNFHFMTRIYYPFEF